MTQASHVTTPPFDADAAAELVSLLEENVDRDEPYSRGPTAPLPGEPEEQRALTPIFYGCYDWHSAVHSHWALARLARALPDAPWAPRILELLDRRLSAPAIDGELRFLAADERVDYEMPYGIAWLLTLAGELAHHGDLGRRLAPLTELAAARFSTWVDRLTEPDRSGEHTQSAFAMGLALDWARSAGADDLATRIERRALELHEGDRAAPVDDEPSAHDFLSPSLGVADLMARLLPDGRFGPWLRDWLPGTPWRPADVVDPADGKLAHAAGLNLSRAWMLRRLERRLPNGDHRAAFAACRRLHERASWRPTRRDPYAVTHWVGTFVVYHRFAPA